VTIAFALHSHSNSSAESPVPQQIATQRRSTLISILWAEWWLVDIKDFCPRTAFGPTASSFVLTHNLKIGKRN
jgi:hypothetical protein